MSANLPVWEEISLVAVISGKLTSLLCWDLLGSEWWNDTEAVKRWSEDTLFTLLRLHCSRVVWHYTVTTQKCKDLSWPFGFSICFDKTIKKTSCRAVLGDKGSANEKEALIYCTLYVKKKKKKSCIFSCKKYKLHLFVKNCNFSELYLLQI